MAPPTTPKDVIPSVISINRFYFPVASIYFHIHSFECVSRNQSSVTKDQLAAFKVELITKQEKLGFSLPSDEHRDENQERILPICKDIRDMCNNTCNTLLETLDRKAESDLIFVPQYAISAAGSGGRQG